MAEWWETFFEGVALDLWRLAVSVSQTVADADRIEKLLEPPAGAALLDAPCGFGRVANELAKRGYRVSGIDLAPEYVAEATERAQRDGLPAEFRVGDMRALPWQEAFDGVFCTGNSFGYCLDEGNASYLRSVARALKPGGRFLLEYPLVAEAMLVKVQMNAWYQVGDVYGLANRRYDVRTGRLHVDYTFIRNGKFDQRECSYRVYTCRQLCELVEAAGMSVAATWGSADRTPFALGSSELLLLATKA